MSGSTRPPGRRAEKILTMGYSATGALDVKLTEEDVKFLEEPYAPVAIVGHA